MTFQEYENELLQHTQSYMVSEHIGRGQYIKTSFDFIDDAMNFRDDVKSNKPLAKIAVYAVCVPPSRPLVNLIVG